MTTSTRNLSPMKLDEQIDQEQVERANTSGRVPVVFIHGLWLLPSSWNRWAALFEEAGFVALTPGWPDDPQTVDEANAHPEVFARKTIRRSARWPTTLLR
jgi:non-heme chloroperoxidase